MLRASAAIVRRCSTAAPTLKSALFVTGRHGQEVARAVVPDLDMECCVKKENFKANVAYRQIEMSVDPDKLVRGAEYFEWLAKEQAENETKRVDLQEQMKSAEVNAEKMEVLKQAQRDCRVKAKSIKNARWELEESVVLPYLLLPNELDPDTPVGQDDRVLEEFGTRLKLANNEDHVTLSLASGELELTGPQNYYLLGQLAHLELELLSKAQWAFQNAGMDMIACPDIVRSFVAEGCNPQGFADPLAALAFSASSDFGDLKSGSGAHLVGAASIDAMASFFVKHLIINPDILPVNYLSVGRQYIAANAKLEPFSLFNSCQNSTVAFMSLSDDLENMQDQFEAIREQIKQFYDQLGYHYRMVAVAAHKLAPAQTYRLAIEMYSPAKDCYIEVGGIGVYRDYLSKRLMLKHQQGNEVPRNLFVLGGSIINATKGIGCIVENKMYQ